MDHFDQLGGSDAENFAKSESAYGHAAQTPRSAQLFGAFRGRRASVIVIHCGKHEDALVVAQMPIPPVQHLQVTRQATV